MTPDPYLFIVIFAGVAVVFPLLPLGLAWLWRKFFQPPKPGAQKNAIYECGVESIGEAQIQFQSQYYLYAIIFLIFDVESLFFYPWAVVLRDLSLSPACRSAHSSRFSFFSFCSLKDWFGRGAKVV